MTIEALVLRFGLPALFVGAGLEGEGVVVAGGLLAHHGLVPLAGAVAAAAAGSFTADQLWFLAGRRFRDSAPVRRLTATAAFARVLHRVERRPTGFIFAFRFLYGLRTVSPVAIGTSAVPARLFLGVNLVAAIVWACVFTAIGWVFGQGLGALSGRLHPGRGAVAAAALLAVVLLAVLGWRYRRRAGVAA